MSAIYWVNKRLLPLLFLMSAGLGLAFAQEFPSRPIKVINPWPAGGPADAIVRPIVQRLGDVLGQPIIVESRAGNNGVIGSALVAKSPADGYTLLFGHVGPTAISPALQRDMPYDSVKDFAPITQVTSSPLMLICRPEIPVKTIGGLIAYAKVNPGKLTYGSFGNGSTAHLAGEMLKTMAQINLLHVPYKGAAPVMTDMLGGQIDCAFFNIAGTVAQIRAGRLRGIAVTTLRRSALMPEFPTVDETLRGFEVNSWFGFMAPAGTPRPIIGRLHAELVKIVRAPDVAELLKLAGLDIESTSPDEFSQQIRSDLTRWAKLIRDTGIKAD